MYACGERGRGRGSGDVRVIDIDDCGYFLIGREFITLLTFDFLDFLKVGMLKGMNVWRVKGIFRTLNNFSNFWKVFAH